MIEACLGKSKREIEKTLLQKQSEPARAIAREKIKPITAERSEIKFTVDEKTLIKLNQLKDLIGNRSLEKIFDHALDAFLLSEQKKRGITERKKSNKTLGTTNKNGELILSYFKTHTNVQTSDNESDTHTPKPTSSAGFGAGVKFSDKIKLTQTVDFTSAEVNHDANFNRPAEFERSKNENQFRSRIVPIDL